MKFSIFVPLALLLVAGLGASEASANGGGGADGVGGGHIGFSLSGSGELPGGLTVSREEILDFGELTGTRPLFPNEALAFLFGDITGNGLEDAPDNIDALHVTVEPRRVLPSALYLSTVKDELGLKDGDVFRFGGTGGIEPFLLESYFIDLTEASDGNVDIDAFSMGPSGEYYFSFADNEDSTLLSGSEPGVVKDGDILMVDGSGAVSVLYTEEQVSDMVSLALGDSFKIGDVLGLAYDAQNQCLLFTVQSPTAHDASVFSDANGGLLVPGYDETALGFLNGVELDALALLPVFQDMPSMKIEPRYPAQGDVINLTLTGGAFNSVFFLLISGAKTTLPKPYYGGGFGPLLLDTTHPYFLEFITQLPFLMGYFNGAGTGVYTYTMPVDPTVMDFHVQATDPLEHVYSNPLTVEFNQ